MPILTDNSSYRSKCENPIGVRASVVLEIAVEVRRYGSHPRYINVNGGHGSSISSYPNSHVSAQKAIHNGRPVMFTLGEVDDLERQLKAAIVALNKKNIDRLTIVEAIDEATLWPAPFDDLAPIVPSTTSVDKLISRTPLFLCAIASEIGFRFEGVGTVFWAKFSNALGLPVTMADRQRIGEAFEMLATRYGISRPTESAFSAHFSIISWPVANALLPVDLVGPVTRLLARAPVTALPGSGRPPNFASLRAWASAAEGARLADWLRFEAPTARVLASLLADNRGSPLSQMSFERLRAAVATESEALFAVRAARLRARTAKVPLSSDLTLGRLALSRDPSGVRVFVIWPPLPPALFDEARGAARSAGWRPRLWDAGAFLHPDMALSSGPFALALQTTPGSDDAAYPDAASIFGAGSDIAAALAARRVDWTLNLLFDINVGRTQAEQRIDVFTGTSGDVWVAARAGGAKLNGLPEIGSSCGYRFYEANLADVADRSILTREGLLSDQRRTLLARHPTDAIGAPSGVVRPDRLFLLYEESHWSGNENAPQKLAAGASLTGATGTAGRPYLRCEAGAIADGCIADLILFERDRAFEALIERRLQLRVESRLPIVDVPVTAELEVGGKLLARTRDRLPTLPVTVPATSSLLAPLYEDSVRTKLLEAGKGVLHIALGYSTAIHVFLERPAASVEWVDDRPILVGADLKAELVTATARSPHRFVLAPAVEIPSRGAAAFGLLLSSGRIADPIQLFTSNVFDFGDITADFGNDVGSRRMFDHGRGVGDVARGRVAWARARCMSLAAVGAKGRIVKQFEDPLVIDLCGISWSLAEQATKTAPSDPHQALWQVAVERGLAVLPNEASQSDAEVFGKAFQRHARLLDPGWPLASDEPNDSAMDEALNMAFSEAIAELHTRGALLQVEDDFDFGNPAEDWKNAATNALRQVRRLALARMIAPTNGGRKLSLRSYADLSIAELAEDISAWTRAWALPRGQLTSDTAASALQLWLSPTACDDVDATIRVLVADPFVSRATRYAALRVGTDRAEVIA